MTSDDVEYNPDSGTYHLEFDRGNHQQASIAVIEVLSVALDTDPLALDPLHTQIDLDSVDRLFSPRKSSTAPQEGHLVVWIAGCEVTVFGHGEVVVAEP